jgi:heptosyltransferase-3
MERDILGWRSFGTAPRVMDRIVHDPEPVMPVWRLLKILYWRARRYPHVARHIMAVVLSFYCNYLVLRLRSFSPIARRPTMAISLVEHLGDIVASEPISRAARQQFPTHRIHWLVRPAYAELLASYRSVDRVVRVRCLSESMLLHAAGVFDEMWDLHLRGRICEQCCIPIVKPGPGPDMDTYYQFGNLITSQCLSAGIPQQTGGPALLPPPRAVARADQLALPCRFVAIHCISNEATRDWPVSSWRHLVSAITGDLLVDVIELGIRPLVVKHDDERARSLCGQLSIMETAEVIRRAALFIGIDSGPAHLANAVGTQGVVLLGEYQRRDDYMPYSGGYQAGHTADLLRATGGVENLSVETVLMAVTRRLQASGVTALQ